MRCVCFLIVAAAACGGPEKPILNGVPHSEAAGAAVAGGAAAVGLAAAIADPDAATRGKPEQRRETERQEIPVKEQVNEGVLDRADAAGSGSGLGSASSAQPAKPAPGTAKRKGPLPKLPSPKEAAEATDPSAPAQH